MNAIREEMKQKELIKEAEKKRRGEVPLPFLLVLPLAPPGH